MTQALSGKDGHWPGLAPAPIAIPNPHTSRASVTSALPAPSLAVNPGPAALLCGCSSVCQPSEPPCPSL